MQKPTPKKARTESAGPDAAAPGSASVAPDAANAPSSEPEPTYPVKTVVAEARLRHKATISDVPSAFNALAVDVGDEVEIIAEAEVDGVCFLQVRLSRKKGWLKAEYLK